MSDICPYFGKCGGCRYQDLSKADYHALKMDFIQNALNHEGIDMPILPMIEVGAHTRRRATFAYENGRLGFNASRSHQIIQIQSCLVLTPALEALLPSLQALAKHLPSSGDLAVLMTEWGADITVVPQRGQQKRFHKKAPKDITQDVMFLEMVTQFCQENKVARFIYDGTVLYQACTLPFPPNVFMQPSVEGEKVLVDLVLKACALSKKVLDLFCGLGTFTRPMALAGKKVCGMDITAESIDVLKKQNICAEVRDLFRVPVLSSELSEYDTVVLDPARAGAKAQCEQLALSGVHRVVMVSCNPITFARDCRILLDGGFHLKWIQPVDQFTFTEHIELVSLLERE